MRALAGRALVSILLALIACAAFADDGAGWGRVWPDTMNWIKGAPRFHVAPEGRPDNTGTAESPWDFNSVIQGRQKIAPGSVVWLRGGTYGRGGWNQIKCVLKGTRERPIIVRGHPGELATLDGGIIMPRNGAGEFVWFWGFEIMNSTLDRTRRPPGFYINARGIRMINMIVHDVGHGPFSYWVEVEDGEIHGCLLWGAGYYDLSQRWQGNPRGSGFYMQNKDGTRYITDNISFRQFTNAIKCWGHNGYVQGFHLEGNVAFDTNGWNIFAAAQKHPITRLKLISNYTYRKPLDHSASVQLGGYGAPIVDAVVRDNYLVAGNMTNYALKIRKFDWLDMTGNTFVGRLDGAQKTDYPDNTCLDQRPEGVKIFVRPNKYEPGRGHVIVYNWDHEPSVEVDLSTILPADTPFEVRDAQNYFGRPLVRGVYDGRPVRFPMTMTKVAQMVGHAPHIAHRFTHTAPEFAVFVVISRGGLGPVGRIAARPPGEPRVAIRPHGGVFTHPVEVTLDAGDAPGVVIRYAADGADPTAKSSLYGKPFTLDKGTTIRACAFGKRGRIGNVISARFRIVPENLPPVRSDGAPRGKLAGDATETRISLKTDEAATCKYALKPGVPYEEMPFAFESTHATEHSHTIKGLKKGAIRHCYVKAQDPHGNANLDDYEIAFYVPDEFAPFKTEFEAEKGELAGPMQTLKDEKVSNGKHIVVALGTTGAARASYTFSAPCTGEYIVWCRVWGPNSSSDSFYVSVDGGAEDIFDIDEKNRTKKWRWSVLNGRGVGGRQRPASIEPLVLYLSKGEHTILFRGREANACLDRLIITNNLKFTPEN